MYLYRRQYVGGWEFDNSIQSQQERDLYATLLDFFGEERNEGSPHAYVELCVGYWRKANAIHGWFVNELANGVDECQDIRVTREDLVKLRDLCKSAIAAPAMAGDILPPTPGFFFGGYEIDEWYMEDMKLTIDIIDKILAKEESVWTDYFYRASW